MLKYLYCLLFSRRFGKKRCTVSYTPLRGSPKSLEWPRSRKCYHTDHGAGANVARGPISFVSWPNRLPRRCSKGWRIGNIKPLCTLPHPPQPPSTPPPPPRATENPRPVAPERQRLGAAGQHRRARTERGPGDGQPARLLGGN